MESVNGEFKELHENVYEKNDVIWIVNDYIEDQLITINAICSIIK